MKNQQIINKLNLEVNVPSLTVLAGPSATGKSTTMINMVFELLLKGERVLYINNGDSFAHIQILFNKNFRNSGINLEKLMVMYDYNLEGLIDDESLNDFKNVFLDINIQEDQLKYVKHLLTKGKNSIFVSSNINKAIGGGFEFGKLIVSELNLIATNVIIMDRKSKFTILERVKRYLTGKKNDLKILTVKNKFNHSVSINIATLH